MGVGDEAMGTLFTPNARCEVLLVVETVGDIEAIEARPAFVEASRGCHVGAVLPRVTWRVGVIKPAGGEEVSSIGLKYAVYSHADGIRAGWRRFLCPQSCWRPLAGIEHVWCTMGPRQIDRMCSGVPAGRAMRFRGGPQHISSRRAPKDQTFDVGARGQPGRHREDQQTGGAIGSIRARKDTRCRTPRPPVSHF